MVGVHRGRGAAGIEDAFWGMRGAGSHGLLTREPQWALAKPQFTR